MTFVSSAREKEENMKTVESLLEKGLIEVANKEEELKVGCVEKCKNTERVKNCVETCKIK